MRFTHRNHRNWSRICMFPFFFRVISAICGLRWRGLMKFCLRLQSCFSDSSSTERKIRMFSFAISSSSICQICTSFKAKVCSWHTMYMQTEASYDLDKNAFVHFSLKMCRPLRCQFAFCNSWSVIWPTKVEIHQSTVSMASPSNNLMTPSH